MRKLVRKHIEDIKPYVPGKPIEEVQRELGLKHVIKLASNENSLGPSPLALKAASGALDGINRYPDSSSFYLKRALSKYLRVREENLIVGNGSDEVIVLATKAFVNEGDEIVIAKPTFLIYEIASRIAGANIKFVPMTNKLKYDLKAMKETITQKTKMVFIANPDNPTGTYVTRDDMAEFFAGFPGNVIVFLDEAYYEFARGFKGYPNGLDYLTKPNVIVTRTFSKAYGLSGLRVGYGISNPEFVGYMDRTREPFNVNIVAQAAAIAALNDKQFLKKTLEHVKREKEFLYNFFDKQKLKYIPSATNFILVNAERDSKKVYRRLLEKGIIVRDMKVWGFDSFIRVTIGTREENKKFIYALREIVR